MYPKELLGKRREDGSSQSLEEHTNACLSILEELLNRPTFASFCHRWKIDVELAKDNLRWAVRLHDVGKASEQFQRAIKENKQSPVSHRLIALPIAYDKLKKANLKDVFGGDEPLLILCLILAHHSCLHSDVFSSEPDIKIVIHPSLSVPSFCLGEAKKMVLALQEMINKKCKEEGEVKIKSVFTYFLSLLKLSDWLASKAFSLGEEVKAPSFKPPSIEEILRGRRAYPFQEKLSASKEKYIVLRAPCGRGKTEAALLWFRNLWENGTVERLIFAMPTQVTSNAMRERLGELFGDEAVALYHGRSLLEQAELQKLKLGTEQEVLNEELLPFLREENLWGEVMGKPVVVTTVDHILFSFVHGFPQSDFAFGNLQTSAIVFDEIHAYDYLMLANLRESFRLLRKMQIPHLIMSATLPEFLLKELDLKDYPLIEDEEGNEIVRFTLKKKNDFLIDEEGNLNDSVLEEIKKRTESGEKQFLIFNTVRRAQSAYRQLRNEDLPCLLIHSRFTYAHRRRKEREIIKRLKSDEPFVLVATQVIEVSLDISSQAMFTELAPIDGVVQRAGRLNRRGDKGDYYLYVFRPPDFNPYKERKNIMERSWELLEEKAFSQGELIEITSMAYEDEKLNIRSPLPELFRETVVFGHSPEEIRFNEEEGRAFKTRDIHCPTIDVVPWDVIAQCKGELDISFVLRHLVPVPIWWIAYSEKEGKGLFNKLEVRGKIFLVCGLPYNEEIGFAEEELKEFERREGILID
ncbi:CRISPR-associated helicase Cas3' [bacterium]|nr:CRISPR-associated helicase Cas3' [bacterium]